MENWTLLGAKRPGMDVVTSYEGWLPRDLSQKETGLRVALVVQWNVFIYLFIYNSYTDLAI